MQITFVDLIDIDYVADTPEKMALGGSQSAMCYLARALAAAGHDVRMVTRTAHPGTYQGVDCRSVDDGLEAVLAGDPGQIVVGLNNAERGAALRAAMPADARLVFWTGHDIDQPGVTSLEDPAVRAAWDGFALVSQWQGLRFVESFGIDPQSVGVMRNAIAPVFERQIINGKAFHEPVELAYTSTPFRGLHVLLHAMPAIRLAEPDVGLKIYSSMSLYQAADDPFTKLYDWARAEPGVSYSPAIPQGQLPAALADVAILAYPNTFDETSCIAVMEAMAAGCRIVTTDRGALPETTAGHARLVAPDADLRVFSARFAAAVTEELQARRTNPAAFTAAMGEQVAFVNETMTWAKRADDWAQWLASS